MTARSPLKPVHTLVAFDPDGKEHTIARTSARYDWAGFIRVAARAGQPEGWYLVAKGFVYKSVHARTRSAHLHDALSYDYRTVKVWRKGSESYEHGLAIANAKAEDLARTNRRQARMPERLAAVEAANQASGAEPLAGFYPVTGAADLVIGVTQAARMYIGPLSGKSVEVASPIALRRALDQAIALRADLARRITPRPAEPGDPTRIDSTDLHEQSADDYAAIERGEL